MSATKKTIVAIQSRAISITLWIIFRGSNLMCRTVSSHYSTMYTGMDAKGSTWSWKFIKNWAICLQIFLVYLSINLKIISAQEWRFMGRSDRCAVMSYCLCCIRSYTSQRKCHAYPWETNDATDEKGAVHCIIYYVPMWCFDLPLYCIINNINAGGLSRTSADCAADQAIDAGEWRRTAG